MKRINFFRMAVMIAALVMVGTVMCSAEEYSEFAHNDKIVNGRVESRNIYKRVGDGKYLECYKRFDFVYDAQNRVVNKEISQWNDTKECWTKIALFTYRYDESTCDIELSLYKNNVLKKSERYIYTTKNDMLQAASQRFKWDDKNNEWASVKIESLDLPFMSMK